MDREVLPIPNLHFLKLGGSLITDKGSPRSARRDLIASLVQEFHAFRQEMPGVKWILGHGSGSFGHIPAQKYDTRHGVATLREWQGFTEVWWEATNLNHLVMSALHQAGLPAITFPASSGAITHRGEVISWDLEPIVTALSRNLLPVVYGDVVFDTVRGGTILSTEDIFSYLALSLYPERIYIAGIEEGVWADYPQCNHLLAKITPQNFKEIETSLKGSGSIDVTGGMGSKVKRMLDLVAKIPGLEVRIFSAIQPGTLSSVLHGNEIGTQLAMQ